LSKYIQPACLPTVKSAKYPPLNTPSWIVGWGTTSSGGETSELLKNAKITVYDGNQYCQDYSYVNWTNQICAGEYTGGKIKIFIYSFRL
jgi:hypothetical protein